MKKSELNKLERGYTKIITNIFHLGLDGATVAVYCYMCSLTETFNPATRQISKELHISPTKVRKCLKTLEDYNILSVVDSGSARRVKKFMFMPESVWKKL